MEITKTEPYRSTPHVNITEDMVRVTLTCTNREFRKLNLFVNTIDMPTKKDHLATTKN